MEKKEVQRSISRYFKQHFIEYVSDNEDGIDRFTLAFYGYDNSPDRLIEACIFFYEEEMEVRTYYDENGSAWIANSKNKPDLYRLLNFINARVFLTTPNDGLGGSLYRSSYMYSPKIYITEDGFWDLTLTTVIPYYFYSVAPLETMDYLTVSCPSCLNQLAVPIFSLALDKITVKRAIEMIK